MATGRLSGFKISAAYLKSDDLMICQVFFEKEALIVNRTPQLLRLSCIVSAASSWKHVFSIKIALVISI